MVAEYLNQLSGSSSVDTLDTLITKFDESSKTIDDLKNEEARLRSANPSREQPRSLRGKPRSLTPCTSTLRRSTRQHPRGRRVNCTSSASQRTQDFRGSRELAISKPFESEPLPGVGSSPWRVLWESAKRFSEEQAYPSQLFPVVGDNSRCVLCHQMLSTEGCDRLSRFEKFVQDDTQVQLDEAPRLYDAQVERITRLLVSPNAVVSDQKDLEVTHAELISGTRVLLDRYLAAYNQTCDDSCGYRPSFTVRN